MQRISGPSPARPRAGQSGPSQRRGGAGACALLNWSAQRPMPRRPAKMAERSGHGTSLRGMRERMGERIPRGFGPAGRTGGTRRFGTGRPVVPEKLFCPNSPNCALGVSPLQPRWNRRDLDGRSGPRGVRGGRLGVPVSPRAEGSCKSGPAVAAEPQRGGALGN